MKTEDMARTLTLGKLIENFYKTYGKRRGKRFLRLLIIAHLVEFAGTTDIPKQ